MKISEIAFYNNEDTRNVAKAGCDVALKIIEDASPEQMQYLGLSEETRTTLKKTVFVTTDKAESEFLTNVAFCLEKSQEMGVPVIEYSDKVADMAFQNAITDVAGQLSIAAQVFEKADGNKEALEKTFLENYGVIHAKAGKVMQKFDVNLWHENKEPNPLYPNGFARTTKEILKQIPGAPKAVVERYDPLYS